MKQAFALDDNVDIEKLIYVLIIIQFIYLILLLSPSS